MGGPLKEMLMRLYVSCLALALVTALLAPISAGAQTPTEDSVCDGLSGSAFGLCNAYCEVMDCDSEAPNANEKACLKVLSGFTKHSDEPIPCAPVECTCFEPSDVQIGIDWCIEEGKEIVECSDISFVDSAFTDITCGRPRSGDTHTIGSATSTLDTPFPHCYARDFPGVPDGTQEVSEAEAEACRAVLRNKFHVPPCTNIVTLP